MIELRTLFYKTTQDFCSEYDLNKEEVIERLTATQLQQDLPTATLLGMTEMELLKKLGLWVSVDEYDEKDDPRNLIYILYSNI